MQYTENYSMNKPQFGENALVTKLNENADTLDTLIYNTRQMQAPPYDPDRDPAYSVGEIVTQNGALYICNTDGTTGPWDATKWDSTTLSKQIELAKQMGGESALADLEDVEITNPSTGQALLFDDDDDVWKNQNLPDVSVTKTATGNPIELTDAASAPMVKCVTEIQGSQDLHGQDKPWPPGAGKNKLPLVLSDIKALNTGGTWTGDSYAFNGVTFTVSIDTDGNINGIKAHGTASATAYLDIVNSLSIDQSYIVNGCPQGGSYSSSYSIWAISADPYNEAIDSGNGVTISSNLSRKIRIRIGTGYTANNLMFYPMIRLSTETDATFAPYSNICPITAYTEGEIEVRGKNLFDKSVMNGVTSSLQTTILTLKPNTNYTASTNLPLASGPTANFFFYSMDGSPSTNYNGVSTGVSRTFSTDVNGQIKVSYRLPSGVSVSDYLAYSYQIEKGSTATTYEPYTSTTHTTTFPSAIYRGSEDCVNGSVVTEWGMIASYAGETLPGEWISDRDEYAPGTTPTTGAQVAYALATPTTSSVTPTNLPIRTLSGYNHIESSTGEMEIEYITECYQPLVDLIQSGNGHTYSTSEQVVGKWIDGKDLYEQTVVNSSTLVVGNNSISIPTDATSIISATGVFVSGSYSNPLNYYATSANGTLAVDELNATSHTLRVRIGSDYSSLLAGAYVYITIRYTKTTQTRSLSAPVTSQKAQIEPLTDKTEEVPTEEEKAVNEEENTNENR